MKILGRHLLAEMTGCDQAMLNALSNLKKICQDAALEAGATIVGVVTHRFDPQGVSVVVVIAESHLSVHTWPEHGYAAVDIFTCGQNLKPEKALEYLKRELGATDLAVRDINRGIPSPEDEVIPHKS